MPNYCDYNMKIRGFPNEVEEFIRILKADYDYDKEIYGYNNRHLYRVFEAEVVSDMMNGRFRDVEVSGYCAWSVYCCMLEGEHTYYTYARKDDAISYGTSIIKEAQRLNLLIEVYSSELGMGFEEHILVSNSYFNPLVFNKGREISPYCPEDYDTVEEFNKDTGLRMNKEYFEYLKQNEELYIEGGYGCAGFKIDTDKTNMTKSVMARTVKGEKK